MHLCPQSLAHNPNGRFVTVCGDGEFVVYTALAWRNKSFGSVRSCVRACVRAFNVVLCSTVMLCNKQERAHNIALISPCLLLWSLRVDWQLGIGGACNVQALLWSAHAAQPVPFVAVLR